MRTIDYQYEELLEYVLDCGVEKTDRTGTGTLSVFAPQLRYDLKNGFPLITTKKVFTKGVFAELLWLLSGDTNANTLSEQGVHIWDDWANEHGELGPIYGHQWRNWTAGAGSVIKYDQIEDLIKTLKTDFDSRRMLVSAWNVADLHKMALAPCHAFFQCYVANGELSLQVYQRSADIFLGVPFNIASYSALLLMLAQQADLKPGTLVWTAGDCHLYKNHLEQAKEQLSREVRLFPTLKISKADSIFDYKIDDFVVEGYYPHPAIKAPVAV